MYTLCMYTVVFKLRMLSYEIYAVIVNIQEHNPIGTIASVHKVNARQNSTR